MRKIVGIVTLAVVMAAGCTASVTTTSDEPAESPASSSASSPSSESGTYADNGVSFSYPADWGTGDVTGAESEAGGAPNWETALGTSNSDIIIVSEYTVEPIDEANIEAALPNLTGTVTQLFESAKGELTAGPTQTTIAGFPAVQYTGTLPTSASGPPVTNDLTFVYDGSRSWTINCQFTSEGEAAISEGCQQVLSTFKVDA